MGSFEVELWKGISFEAQTPVGDYCLGCYAAETPETDVRDPDHVPEDPELVTP